MDFAFPQLPKGIMFGQSNVFAFPSSSGKERFSCWKKDNAVRENNALGWGWGKKKNHINSE